MFKTSKRLRDAIITKVTNFPNKLNGLEVIESVESGDIYIHKDLFVDSIKTFLDEMDESTFCTWLRQHKNQDAIRRSCLWYLGDKFQKIEHYLTANYCEKECGNTTPSESGICLNCGSSLKHL